MPLAVYLLSLCNAYLYICGSLLITVSALIGLELAEDKTLATLPAAMQFFAMMCTSIPASFLMARIGRKYSFMFGAGVGFCGALIALWSIFNHNFWVYCVASFCFGVFTAFGNYYRFTAAEVVPVSKKNIGISYVMAGGVIAAFFGPNLANWSQHLLPAQQYAGAFLVLMVVYVLSALTISQADLPKPPAKVKDKKPKNTGRPILTIMSQPIFIVAVICEMFGYGTMNLVMTSTPLAMHAAEHALSATAFVIQWHVVAMFLPSFLTGHLINRFGITLVLSTGAILGLLCVMVNLNGTTVTHFTVGLVLLGFCWNFLFVGGTTLLTDAYRPEEKAKAQAANDFLVFSTVTVTALCAGGVHHIFGWRVVNWSVVPLLLVTTAAILWLHTSKTNFRTPTN